MINHLPSDDNDYDRFDDEPLHDEDPYIKYCDISRVAEQ